MSDREDRPDSDAVEAYLKSLARLEPEETFYFDCHPGLACFNACCRDLDLTLTPYDVLRLRQALGISSREFLGRHAIIEVVPETGFPHLSLKMQNDEDKSCPFVDEQGCRVYAGRPGACRSYPLGRGASLDEHGNLSEQYVLVQEDHCSGFQEAPRWTSGSWGANQGLDEYKRFNDAYLKLLGQWKQRGQPLAREQFGMVLLGLYRLDEFLKLVIQRKWFQDLDLPDDTQTAIQEDEAKRLMYALEWIEKGLLAPGR